MTLAISCVLFQKLQFALLYDFISDCIIHEFPRPRISRTELTPKQLSEMTEKIVKMDKNSNLFRKLNDCGLISYSEYLFLMSLLTKPRYSVEIYEKITHTQCEKMVNLLSLESIT